MFITATVLYSSPASVLYFFVSKNDFLFAFINSSKFTSCPESLASSKTTTQSFDEVKKNMLDFINALKPKSIYRQ